MNRRLAIQQTVWHPTRALGSLRKIYEFFCCVSYKFAWQPWQQKYDVIDGRMHPEKGKQASYITCGGRSPNMPSSSRLQPKLPSQCNTSTFQNGDDFKDRRHQDAGPFGQHPLQWPRTSGRLLLRPHQASCLHHCRLLSHPLSIAFLQVLCCLLLPF